MLKYDNSARMWRAVLASDPGADGLFYYAVRTTGIFCRPSCKSKPPRPENVRFFSSAAAAMAAGFRPCKRCRPDRPEEYREPAVELSERAVRILTAEYADPQILAALPGRVGASPAHLQRLFKQQTGRTPRVFLQDWRIRQAAALLAGTKLNITEICLAVGFESLSSFYAAFRSITGAAPGSYRRDRFRSEEEPL
jgi:AraC family transcriptional regulator of adaptative response / methylphosphotriester-DNA alkyltransferase methyltransferase